LGKILYKNERLRSFANGELNMRILMIISIVAVATLMFGVDFHPAEGRDVSQFNRESTIYYHEHSDDQHWYGSQRWAVFFDLNNYIPELDSLVFEVESALIYLPVETQIGDLTLYLAQHDHDSMQPGDAHQSVTTEQNELTTGWNEISFDAVADTVFWLIADYHTSEQDQFISASLGGGEHSYFGVIEDEQYYYYNFASYSIQSELLFSLKGHFLEAGSDLELVDAFLTDPLTTGSTVYPIFEVKNNSENIVSDAYIEYTLSYYSDSLQALEGSVDLDDLAPFEEIELDLSGVAAHALDILSTPSQYRWQATLHAVDDIFMYNNQISKRFTTYETNVSKTIIENFVALDEQATFDIWDIQADYEDAEIINFFPLVGDLPFYHDDAVVRFNYYNLIGYPVTVVGGINQIRGYTATYADMLQAHYNEYIGQHRTYVTHDSTSALYDEDNIATVEIELVNASAYVFPDYITQSRVIFLVVEDISELEDHPGLLLRRQIASLPLTGLGFDNSNTFSVSFDMIEGIDTITGDHENCYLLILVQHTPSKAIDFTHFIHFADFEPAPVSAEPELIASNQLDTKIYPNPLSGANVVNFAIQAPDAINDVTIEIYNIKGQLVRRLHSEDMASTHQLNWNGRTADDIRLANGIYFMKVSAHRGDFLLTDHRKFLIIR